MMPRMPCSALAAVGVLSKLGQQCPTFRLPIKFRSKTFAVHKYGIFGEIDEASKARIESNHINHGTRNVCEPTWQKNKSGQVAKEGAS